MTGSGEGGGNKSLKVKGCFVIGGVFCVCGFFLFLHLEVVSSTFAVWSLLCGLHKELHQKQQYSCQLFKG